MLVPVLCELGENMALARKKSKPLTPGTFREATIGNELPLTAPGPGSDMTKLYANEDSRLFQI